MELATIILAAGKGKRMNSHLPKVLHPLLGKPMIQYVIDTARAIGSEKIVLVVGHGKEQVMESTHNHDIEYVVQEQQLGTGHAVQQTASLFKDYNGDVLILSGDVPLLTTSTLHKLIKVQKDEQALASLLTARMPDPTGYGRIVRDEAGYVRRIVEHKDADPLTLRIREINVGIYIFNSRALFASLPLLKNDNNQKEFYLPDVIKIYVDRGERVAAIPSPDIEETHGINDSQQLKTAEQILRSRGQGVTV